MTEQTSVIVECIDNWGSPIHIRPADVSIITESPRGDGIATVIMRSGVKLLIKQGSASGLIRAVAEGQR